MRSNPVDILLTIIKGYFKYDWFFFENLLELLRRQQKSGLRALGIVSAYLPEDNFIGFWRHHFADIDRCLWKRGYQYRLKVTTKICTMTNELQELLVSTQRCAVEDGQKYEQDRTLLFFGLS